MRPLTRGRLCWAALFLALPVNAETVLQVRLDTGAVLAEWPMSDGAELCLTWAHSVTGGRVADCFINEAGRLVLNRSYLHDFAAGLGEVTGRGTLTPAEGGGYWINDISEPMPGNVVRLRIGAPGVGHMLTLGAQRLPLSALAPNSRARLFLTTDITQ